MGMIGGLLGLGGGAGGTGFAGPAGTNITPGTDAGQLATAYGGAQNSLASQQALLTALQGQNGIGNQSQVYGQLQGVANGAGPNPAQAMLSQATGANVANQAALMAGQRGASANPALLARQAAQQGAAIQQNAIGQGATMQANQSLNALGMAGNLANSQVANQIGATGANTGAQQAEQQILQGANAQANNANVAMQSNINGANAQLAGNAQKGQQGLLGGVLGGIGAAIGLADGGEVPENGPSSSLGRFFTGMSDGMSGESNPLTEGLTSLGSGIGGALRKPAGGVLPELQAPQIGQQFAGTAPTLGAAGMPAAAPTGPGLGVSYNRGGKVPAMVSPGEKYLSPKEAEEVAEGKKSAKKSGETIPGKAKVSGDSLKNDTVPRMLEPGGVVVKRSIMNDKDSEGKAAAFVQAVLAKKGRR